MTVKALNTWAHCAMCPRRILPVDVLCGDCASSDRGRAMLKRRSRRDAKLSGSRWELAMRLAAFHRQEAIKWIRLARESQ